MKVRIAHAQVEAGRSPKSFSESAQLICCSFKQKPSSHGGRRFFNHASEQSVELRAALIRLARQILRFRLRVQGVRDNCREAVCRVLTIRFVHASGSFHERIIDKS